MCSSKSIVQCYQSLEERYNGSDKSNLQLELQWRGADSLEIDLINLKYGQQRLSKFYQLLFLICSSGGLIAVHAAAPDVARNLLLVAISLFLLCTLYVWKKTLELVRSEKLIFCLDFGLQLQTTRFWSRLSNYFVSAAFIHDIVINEVIENLDIHYILLIRTRDCVFKQRPLIPVFHSLNPPIDCLDTVYRNLLRLISKNDECKS